jgi:Domain of unknown function (DUF4350)
VTASVPTGAPPDVGAPVAAAPAAAPPWPEVPPSGPLEQGRFRRLRFPLLVALAVVAAAALAALAAGGTSGGDLDPASGGRAGSRAVAQILQRQGVQVTRTEDPAAAQAERGTLVLVHADLLPARTLTAVTANARRIVLVEPDDAALAAVAPAVRPRGSVTAEVEAAACAAPDASAGPARAGGLVYAVRAGVRADLCFPAPEVPGAGSLVQLDAEGGAGNATALVLGQADVLRNAYLADDANAALALRVLGHESTLTWLVPNPVQLPAGGPASLRDLLPPWLGWAGVEVGIAVVLTLVWRARRLGPLVREPLPVVVRAGEAVQGRARLYRRARAVDRAGATLRTAALRRLAGRLAVPQDADPDVVAVRAADATGRNLDEVRRVLTGGPPRDERELVQLAEGLDVLERDVSNGAHGEQREDRA